MKLRISVTYPATDGTMPENVEVEYEDIEPVDASTSIVPVLDMLLLAPSARYLDEAPHMAAAVRMFARPFGGDPADHCQRVTCGHPHSHHGGLDDQNQPVGDDPDGGVCLTCDNPDQCRSFVGKKEAS